MEEAADTPRRATLAEVAALAGVSLKTASRALGGEKYVAHATLARVQAAAQRLGYQRNAAASLLAAGRIADNVSLVTGDLTNPFYSAVAQGLEDAIREHGMHLSVGNSRESSDHEWRLAVSMADVHTKALVVASAMTEHSRYEALQARGIPVVFVDRPAEGIEADSVVFDNLAGGRIAAEHMLSLGHRRIGFIGDYEWLPTHHDRVTGMAEVLDAAGAAEWRGLVRTGAHDAASARECLLDLLSLPEPPTAIVAGNNRIALGVMEGLATRDPRAPRLAVLGFDDFDWAGVLGMSVIAHRPAAMGHHAARLALARVADRDRPTETVTLPMELMRRGSGEIRPAQR